MAYLISDLAKVSYLRFGLFKIWMIKKWIESKNAKDFYIGFLVSVGIFTQSYFIAYALIDLLKLSISLNVLFPLIYILTLLAGYLILPKGKLHRAGLLLFVGVAIFYSIF